MATTIALGIVKNHVGQAEAVWISFHKTQFKIGNQVGILEVVYEPHRLVNCEHAILEVKSFQTLHPQYTDESGKKVVMPPDVYLHKLRELQCEGLEEALKKACEKLSVSYYDECYKPHPFQEG